MSLIVASVLCASCAARTIVASDGCDAGDACAPTDIVEERIAQCVTDAPSAVRVIASTPSTEYFAPRVAIAPLQNWTHIGSPYSGPYEPDAGTRADSSISFYASSRLRLQGDGPAGGEWSWVAEDPYFDVTNVAMTATGDHTSSVAVTYAAEFDLTALRGCRFGCAGHETAVLSLSGARRIDWTRTFSGGLTLIRGIGSNARGDVCITGHASRRSPFNSHPDVYPPVTGAFVSCIDSAGTTRWTWPSGDCFSSGWSVALDDSLNVYVVGEFERCVDLAVTPMPEGVPAGIFVAKFASDGTPRWLREFPTFIEHTASFSEIDHLGLQRLGIALGAQGRIFITGTINGPSTYGAEVVDADRRSAGFFLIAMSDRGETLWTRTVVGGSIDAGGVVAQASGDVTVGATFSALAGAPRGLDPGSGWLDGEGGFVATYRADGVPCWGAFLQSSPLVSGTASVLGVAYAPDGGLRAYGAVVGSAVIGDEMLSGRGTGFVVGFEP